MSIEQVWSKSDLTRTMTLSSGDLTPLRVGVNSKTIVGGFFKKKVIKSCNNLIDHKFDTIMFCQVHVWRRRTGEYAQLFLGESTMIFEIKAGEPDKVVTSLVNGVVKVYRLGGEKGCQMRLAHDLHTAGKFGF